MEARSDPKATDAPHAMRQMERRATIKERGREDFCGSSFLIGAKLRGGEEADLGSVST